MAQLLASGLGAPGSSGPAQRTLVSLFFSFSFVFFSFLFFNSSVVFHCGDIPLCHGLFNPSLSNVVATCGNLH